MALTFDREDIRDPGEVPPPSYESATRAPSQNLAHASSVSISGSQDSVPQRVAEEQLPTYEEATRRNTKSTATAQQQAASQILANTTRTNRTIRTETYSNGSCSVTNHFTGDGNNGIRLDYFHGSMVFQGTSDGGAVITGIGSGSNVSGSQVTSMPDGSFFFTTGGVHGG